jgi:BRCT domain type II-containing protein
MNVKGRRSLCDERAWPSRDQVPVSGDDRLRGKAVVSTDTLATIARDDKRPSVSAPAGRLLAAKSERIRLPNTSPNFRARALSRWIKPRRNR